MAVKISFFRRILDFLMPRLCSACGERLTITDHGICMKCNWHLPRTYFWLNPKENEMAQRFWVLIPIENAAALFFYRSHSPESKIVLEIKYDGKWNVAQDVGRMMANEFRDYGFFDGIDMIVPIPITKKRRRERGYNQSHEIAVGVHEITGLPIVDNAVERVKFSGSQTKRSAMERKENVKNVFRLKDSSRIKDKHVLLIDDVVTTGSTIISCAEELLKGGVRTFSVLSIGYTKR